MARPGRLFCALALSRCRPQQTHPPGPGDSPTSKEYFVRGAKKQKVSNAKSLSSESCAVEHKNSSDGMRFLNRRRERTPNTCYKDLPEPSDLQWLICVTNPQGTFSFSYSLAKLAMFFCV